MFGIKCLKCEKQKLRYEFPERPLFETCNHASIVCFRCSVSVVKDTQKCPYPDCESFCESDSVEHVIEPYEDKLSCLFGYKKAVKKVESDASDHIWLMSITGQKFRVEYKSEKTILSLKIEVLEKMDQSSNGPTNYDIRFACKGKALNYYHQTPEGTKKKATLQSMGIAPGDFISIQVVQGIIKNSLRYVRFNIKWDYTGHSEEHYSIIENGLQDNIEKIQATIDENEIIISDIKLRKGASDGTLWYTSNDDKINTQPKEIREDIQTLKKQIESWKKEKMNYRMEDTFTEFLDGICFIYDGTDDLQWVDRKQTVYQNNGKAAIKHSGDHNDDERKKAYQKLEVNFPYLPQKVTHLVFAASAYGNENENKTLALFKDIEISILTTFNPLADINITQAKSFPSVILCMLVRSDNDWQVIPCGMPCLGSTVKANYGPLKESVMSLIESYSLDR